LRRSSSHVRGQRAACRNFSRWEPRRRETRPGRETAIELIDLGYLKYDVKNIVHQPHSNGSVLIIGAGGGRDILSAISMGQKQIRAVEINQGILRTVNSRFGDFSGHWIEYLESHL
jgi:hypothetical protein